MSAADDGTAVDRVLAAARSSGLDEAGRPVVAMVSGGRDSVCLLDVAVRLLGGDRVVALHVNYGLRDEADGDEAHVAGLCSRLGVELRRHRAHRLQDTTGNLQAWARDERYGVATQIALAAGAIIATGHTASDQAETVLYRLASSPGRRALLGMAQRDGLLLRPLLGISREDTTEYCAARGLTFREDASNADERFARTRLRHGLVPALRAVHPAAEANVVRTAALLRDEAAVLDRLVSDVLEGRDRIEVARLAALDPALARLVVVRLAEHARPGRLGLVPAAGARLGELLALGRGGGTAALDLGGGVRALVEYGVLRMADAREDPVPEPVTLAVPGRVAFGAWEVVCELAAEVPEPSGETGSTLIDGDGAGGELVVRAWRAGDRMSPSGLGGTKTLSDLFTDRRVPRGRRRTMPVVEVAGRIAWVPGVATDEALRVRAGSDATTGRALRLRARRIADGCGEAAGDGDPATTLRLAVVSEVPPQPSDPAVGEVLVTAEALQARVRELGAQISLDYVGKPLLLVGVLKGAVFFLSDLMRWIDIPVEVDFMAVASYGSATDSSGVVRILKDLDIPIDDRDVLIVEDIVDSGLTLQYLLRNLGSRNPRSLEVCALLTKPARRKVQLPTRYVGFEIPNEFAIGYGLDHAERYRNLPFVAALAR